VASNFFVAKCVPGDGAVDAARENEDLDAVPLDVFVFVLDVGEVDVHGFPDLVDRPDVEKAALKPRRRNVVVRTHQLRRKARALEVHVTPAGPPRGAAAGRPRGKLHLHFGIALLEAPPRYVERLRVAVKKHCADVNRNELIGTCVGDVKQGR